MEKLPLELTKILYMRFASTYGEKFVKHHPNDQFVQLWWEEWSEGMAGIDPAHIKEALSYCRLNLEWPPSIAEFRRLCESASGVPSVAQCLQAAIRRDFNHPVIKIAYDKVGSWAMKNDREADLKPKFQAAYTEALNEFRSNTAKSWARLAEFNSKPTLPEPPSKIPSEVERMGFKERIAHYQELSKIAKSKLEPKDHPFWDENKIMLGSKEFEQNIFDERRKYLISLDEYVAGTLPVGDWYGRTRYLSEIEGQERIKSYSASSTNQEDYKTQPRGYNSSKSAYKPWND